MKKLNIKMVIIALLFVAIAFSTYILLNDHKNNDSLVNTWENNNKNTVFTAAVGKFRLDLPSKYVVIQTIDGETPTGSSTVIEVGQYIAYLQNVVNSPSLGKAIITATPINGKSIDALLELYIADDTIKNTQQVDIDGQESTFLTLDGDVQKELYYFDHTGIFYVLYFENTNQSDELQTQKEAIIGGFTLIE
ncbi:hypothetical protein KBC85_00745 [Candidatus Saccharibacteria bacterium]|nr:hypothetical protein [Candidatus Saccharibacteria bacterium]